MKPISNLRWKFENSLIKSVDLATIELSQYPDFYGTAIKISCSEKDFKTFANAIYKEAHKDDIAKR